VEQQHQAGFHLVELPLLATQIQSHQQALLESILIGRGSRGLTRLPQRGDAHGSGVPAEAAGAGDRRLLERIFKEFTDRHRQRTCSPVDPPSIGRAGWQGNRLRAFVMCEPGV
jgi:hypothetical protein